MEFRLWHAVRPGPIFEFLALEKKSLYYFEGFAIIFWKIDPIFAGFWEVRGRQTATKEGRRVGEESLSDGEGVLIWRCADDNRNVVWICLPMET